MTETGLMPSRGDTTEFNAMQSATQTQEALVIDMDVDQVYFIIKKGSYIF